MPRVAAVLAKLAEFDAPLDQLGRLSNRPKRSLEMMLRLFHPQTRANADQRIAEMKRRFAESPGVAFELVRHQLCATCHMLDAARAPEYLAARALTGAEQEARRDGELVPAACAYVELVLSYAGRDGGRWAELLDDAGMTSDIAELALERLEGARGRRLRRGGALWASIRRLLRADPRRR